MGIKLAACLTYDQLNAALLPVIVAFSFDNHFR